MALELPVAPHAGAHQFKTQRGQELGNAPATFVLRNERCCGQQELCKHWVATRPAIPDILKREVGGRRVPRQPGQVRKEAALTSVSRVAGPASHLALKRYSAYRAPRLGARCTYPSRESPLVAEVEDREKSAPKPAGKGKADGPAAQASEPAAASHAALARKYRPKVFAELIGQDAMVRTLRNAFAS